eukprot:TRINITY_DN92476_c0_g1_i1.p1 TRINITY_DN92476_c0_g1~~TRINITY_DN92476_c0_g1_i1.p1  ORF type:complete len:565 (+),score=107.91 TRINITY_DN92476_c0_g1_i1:86-1780(+)
MELAPAFAAAAAPRTWSPGTSHHLASAPQAVDPSQGQSSAKRGLGLVAVAVTAAGVRQSAARRNNRRGRRLARLAVAGEVTEANPLRVIVAGGGVGGLMTAKALTTVPTLKVSMLEQATQFARFGGPIQLASNALSTIREIDEDLFNTLMTKFTFTGHRKNGLVDGLRTEWYCPFDAMKTAADQFDLPYTGVVDRPDLQEVLLQKLPEGTCTNAKRVTGYKILPDHQGVEVTCADNTKYECDVLIGADGIWSATRAQMFGEPAKGPGSGCNYSGYVVFAGETVYQPEDYWDVGYKVYMGPSRYFVCSDVGRGRIQWYAFVSLPENAEIPEENAAKKEYTKNAFFGWSQQVLDLIEATPAGCIEDRALYDRAPSFFKSWADGPVCLLGDAVHPMMPNLGQGGCQAMEDGFTIMKMLKDVKHRREVPDVLQSYYRARIFRTATVQFLSRIASDLLLDTFTFPWKAEEGLSAPHGAGKGDFNYNAVVVSYLRYLLPAVFVGQFTFLYSFHPYKWASGEVKALVEKVMNRHKEDAHAAWQKREGQVERGEQDDSGEGVPSFFAKVKTY